MVFIVVYILPKEWSNFLFHLKIHLVNVNVHIISHPAIIHCES